MSSLAERPATAPRATPADLLPLLTAAVRAVLTLLVPIVALSILTWVAAVRSTSSLVAVVRVGADAWLLGHGVDLAIVGGSLGLAPLGVTLLAILSAVRAVRIWVRDQEEASRAVPFWRGLGIFAGAYGVLTVVVALVSRSGVSAADPLTALLGGFLLAGVAALAATWRHRPDLSARVPPFVTAGLRPAVVALAALLALGSLTLAVALVRGRADIALLHDALDPGVLGGLLLTLGQALLVPTFAVWGLAWIAGPGFAVGVATSVAPGGTTLATLPAIPLLGALPAEGPTPGWAWFSLALPVLVGGGAWLLEARRGTRRVQGVLRRCATALVTGAVTGVLTSVLGLFASGSAGPGRMSELGPPAGLLGVVVAGEVAAGGLLAVLIVHGWTAWRGAKLVVALPDSDSGRRLDLLGRLPKTQDLDER
ncbi:MAG: cell division protein PerM [Janthinobacterium lividum]